MTDGILRVEREGHLEVLQSLLVVFEMIKRMPLCIMFFCVLRKSGYIGFSGLHDKLLLFECEEQMNFVDMSVGKVGVDFKCSIIIPKRCFVVLQTEMGISAVIIGKREMSFEEASL